jgi:fatty acid amide hydrolase 2
MLGIGPLARRAEDLMPVLRTIAGPDGQDQWARQIELGDPAEVALEGLDVVVSDDATILPVSLELRNARVHAARALAEAGARVRKVSLPSARTVVEPYLGAVRESGELTEILTRDGSEPPQIRRLIADAIRGRSPHTPPLLITMVVEQLSKRLPDWVVARAERAEARLRDEITETIGDGVMLHPPFARVAPRHSVTVGRPWLLAPMALFNLLGLPVTQVPLGIGEKGLPLGVQVAAGSGRDHVAIAVALELERAFGGWVSPR